MKIQDHVGEMPMTKRVFSNEKGSIMMTTLALAAVIAIAATSVVSSLNNQIKVQSRNGSIEDARNLATAIQMLYSEAGNCQSNIVPQAFGTDLSQLKSKLSYSGNIQILYPHQGPTHGILLAPQKTYQRMQIQSIGFTKIKQITALSGTYLADLTIQAVDHSGQLLRPVTVPFYISTNPAGVITSCFATHYPFASDPKFEMQSLTLEDVLCSQTTGNNTIYSSSGQTCIPKPSVVGSL